MGNGKWESLQAKAKNRSDLDKFGDTKPLYGKMGRIVLICVRHFISQSHLQTSLKKPYSAKIKKMTFLQNEKQTSKRNANEGVGYFESEP